MLDYLLSFFQMAQFMPHGMCLLWRPDLVVMHGVSDLLIAAAYFTIPVLILRAVRARPDLLDPKVARMFAAFITACGASHAAGVVTLWVPLYGVQGLIKAATATVSIYTAIQLIRLLPGFLTMPSRDDLARSQAEALDQTITAAAAQKTNRQLRGLQDDLMRSNRDLDEFAYIASHDLKEPVRGVSINANFLLRENLSDSMRVRVERITRLCERMDGLISDLLAFSSLSRKEVEPQVIDMTDTVRTIEEDLRETLAPVGGKVEISTDLPAVRAVRSKVDIVLRNLVTNAIKYNDRTPRIVRVGFLPEVEVNGVTMHDAFYVRDDGIGIDPRNREKVFRIFSRLNRSETYEAGSGVGLAFVKRIVEDFRGSIDLVSEPGEGTTFYFTLPLAASADDVPQEEGPRT